MAIMIAGLRPGADDLDADPMSAHHIAEILDRFQAR
jgi:hypothetical protein